MSLIIPYIYFIIPRKHEAVTNNLNVHDAAISRPFVLSCNVDLAELDLHKIRPTRVGERCS